MNCPCPCRPSEPCGEPLRGIEVRWAVCASCHVGDHWEPGDDDPAFDWPKIFQDAEAWALLEPVLTEAKK
jgi:hypothetical protein